jgi:hypothetical protein
LLSDKPFKCGNCGWSGDADLNEGKKIAAIDELLAGTETDPSKVMNLEGAAVNQPRGSNGLVLIKPYTDLAEQCR